MAIAKPTPKDVQVMASILKELGVEEYEPRVLNQMLEFTYRYVTGVLDDALLFSNHAKKKGIDVEDVKLAIQLQMDKYFASPPPREILIEISKQKNSTPLPTIKSSVGLRLPPDRYSLTACNYRLKSTLKKPRIHQVSRLNISTMPPNANNKMNPALNLNSKSGATLSVVTKPNAAPTVTIVSRTPAISKPPPPPIIKFSEANKGLTSVSSPLSQPLCVSTSSPSSLPQNTMPSIGLTIARNNTNENISLKRKREDEMDDYDAE